MKEEHRDILRRSRVYLLDNINPSEIFLSTLLQKNVLSCDMINEIKDCFTKRHDKIGKLLDFLTTRGPDAFNDFCVALVESEHEHVARQLKVEEGDAEFRREISVRHSMSDDMLNTCAALLKKNSSVLEWLADHKHSHRAQVQAVAIETRESEIEDLSRRLCALEQLLSDKDRRLNRMEYIERSNTDLEETLKDTIRNLENKNYVMEKNLSSLKHFFETCVSAMEEMTQKENQEEKLMMFFLSEEERVDEFKGSLGETRGFETFSDVLETYQVMLKSLTGICKGEEPEKLTVRENTARDNRQKLAHEVKELAGMFQTRSPEYISEKLAKIQEMIDTVFNDVSINEDNFRRIQKEKTALEEEVMKLLNGIQDMHRSESAIIEKNTQINQLRKVLNKKASKDNSLGKESLLKLQECRREVDDLREKLTQQRTDLNAQVEYIDNFIDNVSNATRRNSCTSAISYKSDVSTLEIIRINEIRNISTKQAFSVQNKGNGKGGPISESNVRSRRINDGCITFGSSVNFQAILRQPMPTKTNLKLPTSKYSPSGHHNQFSSTAKAIIGESNKQAHNEINNTWQIRERKRSTTVREGHVGGDERGRVLGGSNADEQTKKKKVPTATLR